MNKICVGIEFTDEVCRFAWYHPKTDKIQPLVDGTETDSIPAYLGFCGKDKTWLLGYEAEELIGQDSCIVMKNILSLWKNNHAVRAGEVWLQAEEIIEVFLGLLVKEIQHRIGTAHIDEIVYCIDDISVELSDVLHGICSRQNLPNSHFYNRQECFMYYLMSQKQEIWNNYTYLLDYNSAGLDCYEMGILKGCRPITAFGERETIVDAPSMTHLSSGVTGQVGVDIWLSDFIEKKMDDKVVTSVILTGEGFQEPGWAKQFIRTVISQKSRKVYHVDGFFGMGAAYAAYHISDGMRLFPYICVCDGRISTTVSVFIGDEDDNRQLILAKEGMNCYEARKSVVLHIKGQSVLHLYMKNTGSNETARKTVDIAPILIDRKQNTRIQLAIAFDGVNQMFVRAENLDAGSDSSLSGKIIWESFPV